MSVETTSNGTQLYSSSITYLEESKKQVKENLFLMAFSLGGGLLLYGIFLTLSLLAVKGVLATPGGIGWKFGIFGTAYISFFTLMTVPFLFALIPMLKAYFVLHRLEKALRKTNDISMTAIVVNKRTSPFWLPTEMVIHIFSFLTPKELGKASQVCAVWHFAAQDKTLWTRILTIIASKTSNHTLKMVLLKDPNPQVTFRAMMFKKIQIAPLNRRLVSSNFLGHDFSSLKDSFPDLADKALAHTDNTTD